MPTMLLTRSATFGTVKDDIREVGFLVAPYAVGVFAAGSHWLDRVDWRYQRARHRLNRKRRSRGAFIAESRRK